MIWHTASGTYIGTFLTLTINIELVYGTYVVIFTLLMEKQYERVYGGVVPIYIYIYIIYIVFIVLKVCAAGAPSLVASPMTATRRPFASERLRDVV